MRAEAAHEPAPQRRRGGPWLLLLPLFLGALAMRLGLERGARRPARPEAPAVHATSEVAGRAGACELADGSRVVARLARLHAGADERTRQAFERDALRGRLALEEGEPFRLTLAWMPAPAGAERAQPSREALAAEPAELVLAGLSVRDARGEALRVLVAPSVAPDQPADPLAVLLAPPREALRAGETIELVLWGREPEEGARLRAGVLAAGAERALELELAPRALVAREEAELARVERGSRR